MPMAWSFCSATGPMPGNLRTGSGPRKASSAPPGTIKTPRGFASELATFATERLVAMPALDGRPTCRSISSVSLRTTRSIVKSGPASPVGEVEPFAARKIEEHLVDARDLRDGRVPLGDPPHAAGVVTVHAMPRRKVDRVRRELRRLLHRHAGPHAERAHLVARRSDDTALSGQPADDDGFADETRIEEPLDRHEKRVQVQRQMRGAARAMRSPPAYTDHAIR